MALEYQEYLSKINLSHVFDETESLGYILDYITAYNKIAELIKLDEYGFLFKIVENKVTGKTALDLIEENYKRMNNSICNLNL
ncbi:hypothetical protein ABES80_00985 [Bacillus gobiensis]|uniref:hypothetical protein n=1 Tax=Bacillus gobiensis TaxID=1441095 RepID=UPI003D1D1A16